MCWPYTRGTRHCCVGLGYMLHSLAWLQVGFPDDNAKYASVMKAAGEALTQVVHLVADTESMPLAEDKGIDDSIQCFACNKWRVVTKAYHDVAQHIDGWHCGIEGSPVPSPANGRWVGFSFVPGMVLFSNGMQ